MDKAPLLYALFALSALRIARGLRYVLDPGDPTATDQRANKRDPKMVEAARMYFSEALMGVHRGMSIMSEHTAEALYYASVLLTHFALFALAETDGGPCVPGISSTLWLRLSGHTRTIMEIWRKLPGVDDTRPPETLHGYTDSTTTEADDFNEHGLHPFAKLTTFGAEFERSTPEDVESYQVAVVHLAHMFRAMESGNMTALSLCQYVLAVPSRIPGRFVQLVEAQAPRALVIMAHIYAQIFDIGSEVIWMRDIAKRQVENIHADLPRAWAERMGYPLMSVAAESIRMPHPSGSLV